MNILFTCAGRRNYLINYFKVALNGGGQLLAADLDPTAPAMVDADQAFLVPGIYEPDYIEAIIEIIRQNKVNALISLNDLELPILAANRHLIESSGCRLLVSGQKSIDIAFDKWKTFEFIISIGLKSPKTYLGLKDTLEAIEEGALGFPLVVKPRWGSASIGIEFPENKDELILTEKLLSSKLSRTSLKTASERESDRALIFQEKIQGQEFGMDVLNDFNGNYVGTFARKKLSMRSGETDKAESLIRPDLERIGSMLGQHLRHIGNLDCDVFEKEGEYYVLELNPRFGGGYPFSHEAGVNTAAIYLEWLSNGNDIDSFLDYRPGRIFSKCDRLIEII